MYDGFTNFLDGNSSNLLNLLNKIVFFKKLLNGWNNYLKIKNKQIDFFETHRKHLTFTLKYGF